MTQEYFGPLPEPGDKFDFDKFLIWLGQQTIAFDKIITGSLQVAQAAQSSDFVSGSAGWQISGAGDAEFNNVTVRGTIFATAGEIGGLDVVNTLTMGAGGILRSAASGLRYELTATSSVAIIDFYSGHADETAQGWLRLLGGATPIMWLKTPTISSKNIFLLLEATGEAELKGGTASTLSGADSAIIVRDLGIEIQITDSGGQILVWNIGDGTTKDGTAAAPLWSYVNDPDTGGYRSAANTLNWSTGGSTIFHAGPNYFRINAKAVDVRFQGEASFATTGSAANAFITSGTGLFRISTSALKYKSRITENVDYLADIDLRPTKHYRKDDGVWRYGFVANWLSEQDPLLGEYDIDGEIKNYDTPAVLVVMAVKINRLERLVKELQE